MKAMNLPIASGRIWMMKLAEKEYPLVKWLI
jgi:hypothetical protein